VRRDDDDGPARARPGAKPTGPRRAEGRAPGRGRDEAFRDRVHPSPEAAPNRTYRRSLQNADGSERASTGPASRPSAETMAPRRRRKVMPSDVTTDIRSYGSPRQAAMLEARLADAANSYERDRYPEALSTLRDLAKTVPGVAAVRELYGLTLYRLGRWKEALRELNAFVELTASVDQNPVLADCERALGRHARVEQLWADLRRAGAGSDVLAEGRLVMAGSLADRGRFHDAIALLEPAVLRAVRKPLDRHLRQWYALADLYERSGDLPRARELFRRIVDADPELSDALERLANLR